MSRKLKNKKEKILIEKAKAQFHALRLRITIRLK
jgi:hypothetical protein